MNVCDSDFVNMLCVHASHWPRFDQLARQVLFNSRYSIEVPGEEIIFEHFFSPTERTVGEIVNSIDGPRCLIAQLPFPTISEVCCKCLRLIG